MHFKTIKARTAGGKVEFAIALIIFSRLKACDNQFDRQKNLLTYVLKQEKSELYMTSMAAMEQEAWHYKWTNELYRGRIRLGQVYLAILYQDSVARGSREDKSILCLL